MTIFDVVCVFSFVMMVSSFIALCYIGRHIFPQGILMMLKDVWKLKSVTVRAFRHQIQKYKCGDKSKDKENLSDENNNGYFTQPNKDNCGYNNH